MMIEPQRLEYVSSDFDPPAILAKFDHYQQNVEFPVAQVCFHWLYLVAYYYLAILGDGDRVQRTKTKRHRSVLSQTSLGGD